MENLPPFYVGQKVVCIEPFINYSDVVNYPRKGMALTVRTVEMCEIDRIWVLRFYEIVNPPRNYLQGFIECRWNAVKFRAIEENFQSITLEKVLEEETKLISVN